MRNVSYVLDGQLEWAPLDNDYDVVAIGDPKSSSVKRYPIMSGKAQFVASLKEQFPDVEDHAGIDKYMQLLSTVRTEMLGFVGLKFMPVWMAKLALYSGLLRFYTKFFDYSARSLHDVLLEVSPHNAELRAVLGYCFGDYGTLPKDTSFSMHAVLVNHFLLGVAYPVGGASEIAYNIVPTILRSGGACYVRALVGSILLDSSTSKAIGVIMAKDGREIRAPIVISDAGIFNTFESLLPQLPKQLTAHVNAVQHGWGGMSVFVGLRGTHEGRFLMVCMSLLYMPGYCCGQGRG